MMYNKNICLTTFQVKSHILILIQEFKVFKEVYTGSDPSYHSQRGALQPSLPLGRDLKPSAMALGKSSCSRGTAGTRSCNKAKGICRGVRDQHLRSSLIWGPPVPPRSLPRGDLVSPAASCSALLSLTGFLMRLI